MNYDQLAHAWAHRTKEAGKAGGNGPSGPRMFFRGDRIYSYGHHFCIARLLPDNTVLMTTQTYSPTTSGHISTVRSAVRHLKVVDCHDPDRMAYSNKEYAERQIRNQLEEAQTERRVRLATRVNCKLRALRIAEKFNEYLAVLPADERKHVTPIDLTPLLVSDEDREVVRLYDADIQAKREVKYEKDAAKHAIIRAKAALKESEKIAEWRARIYNHSLYNLPDMLRLSADGQNVETSRGAEIPVSHAKRLWPLIENCKAVGEGMQREVRVGHYTLTEIKPTGDIVVGCHTIGYAEIERIAKELGLLEVSHG